MSYLLMDRFKLNEPKLKIALQHIIEHPADPLYNSFIISGNELGGTIALEWLRKELIAKYPKREILLLQRYDIKEFLANHPSEMLANYYQLHPHLLCVLIADLEENLLKKQEQDQLALFLKSLTKHHIQVAVSTSLIAGRGYLDSSFLTPEIWSWYMSGREYYLRHKCVTYTQDLSSSLTLEQDRKRLKLISNQFHSHSFGTLYTGILTGDDGMDFSEWMSMELGLCWLGNYNPPCYIFPRAVCPTCEKEKLMPYCCIASALSGRHVIKFYCLHCHERLATNNASDYYHVLYTYGTRCCYSSLHKQHKRPDLKGE